MDDTQAGLSPKAGDLIYRLRFVARVAGERGSHPAVDPGAALIWANVQSVAGEAIAEIEELREKAWRYDQLG